MTMHGYVRIGFMSLGLMVQSRVRIQESRQGQMGLKAGRHRVERAGFEV